MQKEAKSTFPPARLKIFEGLILLCLLLLFFTLSKAPRASAHAYSFAIYKDNHLIARLLPQELNHSEFEIAELPGIKFSYTEGGLALVENDCPDGYCLRQGRIKAAGEQIICLPKALMIRVESQDDEVDYITPAY